MPFLRRLDVVTPPTVAAVSQSLVQQQLRLDQGDDSSLLAFHIASATLTVEKFLGRALMTQTLKYSLQRTTIANSWPMAPAPLFILPLGIEWTLLNMQTRDIGLMWSPVQSVTSVTIGTWGQADTTLVLDTDYNIDLTLDPGRIHLINEGWQAQDHISFTYVAGYGTTTASVPSPIIHGLLLLIAHHWEHRGDERTEIPEAVYNLLWPYRLFGGFGL